MTSPFHTVILVSQWVVKSLVWKLLIVVKYTMERMDTSAIFDVFSWSRHVSLDFLLMLSTTFHSFFHFRFFYFMPELPEHQRYHTKHTSLDASSALLYASMCACVACVDWCRSAAGCLGSNVFVWYGVLGVGARSFLCMQPFQSPLWELQAVEQWYMQVCITL